MTLQSNYVFILRKESFQSINNWLNDAKNLCRSECGIVLIGNKLDLSNSREISTEDGFKYCEDNSK